MKACNSSVIKYFIAKAEIVESIEETSQIIINF